MTGIGFGDLLAICFMMTCLPSSAQWLNYPDPRIPRTADGKPNLSAPAPKLPDGKPDFSGIWRAGVQNRPTDAGDQVVIGSNKFVDNSDTTAIEVHHVDPEAEARQIARLKATREKRDNERVKQLLDRLEHDAQDTSVNLMPITSELVKARASIGEIVSRLRTVFGVYVEEPVF